MKADVPENELVTAFNQIFDPQPQITFMMILRNFFPILNIIVCPGLVVSWMQRLLGGLL